MPENPPPLGRCEALRMGVTQVIGVRFFSLRQGAHDGFLIGINIGQCGGGWIVTRIFGAEASRRLAVWHGPSTVEPPTADTLEAWHSTDHHVIVT